MSVPYQPGQGLESRPGPITQVDNSILPADPAAGTAYSPTRLATDPRTTARAAQVQAGGKL